MILASIPALLTASVPAHASMNYLLVSQWYERGNHFCKYGNDTVLNIGINLCPLEIQG